MANGVKNTLRTYGWCVDKERNPQLLLVQTRLVEEHTVLPKCLTMVTGYSDHAILLSDVFIHCCHENPKRPVHGKNLGVVEIDIVRAELAIFEYRVIRMVWINEVDPHE